MFAGGRHLPLPGALQTSLYPDYGHRMPRSAAGQRDLALVQFTSNPACGHACQFGKDRPQ